MPTTLKKMKFIVFLFSLVIFASCQKVIDDFPTNDLPDLTSKVNSSVSGFVTDENNAPVNGATVHFGNQTFTTDSYGYFSFNNVEVIQNAAEVVVKKSGYFPGIKTYIATNNKSAFFRIKLIPKNTAGTFIASNGGNVTLTNGASVVFPADAVVIASSGIAYNGSVNVSASWINPTANDVSPTMPGDLRGIDAQGSLKILESFGMMAVELTDASGQLLQIAPGKKATLTFPIPSAILNNAPVSIPLWYFDESLGLWKEEGAATKTGNSYIGEVSHFSFWNCDVPNNYVKFNCTILDALGHPLPFVWVRISVSGNPYNAGWGLTDSSGYVHGAVPNNASLYLEVYNNYNCGNTVYAQSFNTTNVNISLGNITIPNSTLSQAYISGTVTNCSNGPVTNGFIIMEKDNQFTRYPLSNTGSYNFSSILCSGSTPANFIGEDATTGQQSNTIPFTIVNGANTVPNIQACGININQFFNYNINGTNYSFTSPTDTFNMYVNVQTTPASIQISAQNINSSGGSTSTRYGTLNFDQPGIAVGSTQNLTQFYVTEIVDSLTYNAPINVNITEYGNIGEFISGNYSGAMTGAAPTNTLYTISGSFRIRRSQ
jgi:hypothetical protein